jgi:hypothetical protein
MGARFAAIDLNHEQVAYAPDLESVDQFRPQHRSACVPPFVLILIDPRDVPRHRRSDYLLAAGIYLAAA